RATMPRSEIQLEPDRVSAFRGLDAEVDDPIAAHVELHPLDHVAAVAERLAHIRLRREPVAVVWHPARDAQLRAVDWMPIPVAQLDRPGMQLAPGDGLDRRLVRDGVPAGLRDPSGRRVRVGMRATVHAGREE